MKIKNQIDYLVNKLTYLFIYLFILFITRILVKQCLFMRTTDRDTHHTQESIFNDLNVSKTDHSRSPQSKHTLLISTRYRSLILPYTKKM
jgi:hypothetical protein